MTTVFTTMESPLGKLLLVASRTEDPLDAELARPSRPPQDGQCSGGIGGFLERSSHRL
jgi:hypothetical protein